MTASDFLSFYADMFVIAMIAYALLWGLTELVKRAANRWWGRRGR